MALATTVDERRILWRITLVCIAASGVLGQVLPRFEYMHGSLIQSTMSAGPAEAFLSSVSSGMMALTGIVFAIAFVLVQFSATAYSPRLTLILTRDPTLAYAFGSFVSTFVYSLSTLAWLDRADSENVPSLSILVVWVLIALSIFFLARLVTRLGRLQITGVLRLVGDDGRRIIEKQLLRLDATPPRDRRDEQAPVASLPPVSQTLRYHGEPLSVVGLDVDLFVRQAQSAGSIVVLEAAIGDTLVDEMVVARSHGATQQLQEEQLMRGFQLGAERILEVDINYAFRLLVDVAIRALSPAVNDPTTAVQALDQIEDLLARLGQRALPSGCAYDSDGSLRLMYPTASWDDFLSLAFDEIRLYGRTSIQVMRRLHSALRSLEGSVAGSRREAVQKYLAHLDTSLETPLFDTSDRALVLSEDRQGIGVSRH